MQMIATPSEMGSLRSEVTAQVAKRLGISVVCCEISDQFANKMWLRKSHVIRCLEGKVGILKKITTNHTSLPIVIADEIFRLAESCDVAGIRGWGATHLVNGVPLVLRAHALRSSRQAHDGSPESRRQIFCRKGNPPFGGNTQHHHPLPFRSQLARRRTL